MCIILNEVNPDWYFYEKQKKLAFDANHENVNMSADACIFQLLIQVANTLDPKIELVFEEREAKKSSNSYFCSTYPVLSHLSTIHIAENDIFLHQQSIDY